MNISKSFDSLENKFFTCIFNDAFFAEYRFELETLEILWINKIVILILLLFDNVDNIEVVDNKRNWNQYRIVIYYQTFICLFEWELMASVEVINQFFLFGSLDISGNLTRVMMKEKILYFYGSDVAQNYYYEWWWWRFSYGKRLSIGISRLWRLIIVIFEWAPPDIFPKLLFGMHASIHTHSKQEPR